MENTILIYLFLSSFIVLTIAVTQEFRLYSKLDQQGDAITLTGKYPQLPKYWEAFLAENNETEGFSYCTRGWFTFYVMSEFGGSGPRWGHSWREDEYCSNMAVDIDFQSGRVHGPKDTETVAFALYSSAAQGGEEYLIEGIAAVNNIPINATSYAYFGHSNWTVFEGNNFDGNYTCLIADKLVVSGSDLPFYARSVVRGCIDSKDVY